jgi:hypothetical protein
MIADYVLHGALYHAGASHAIVYEIFPAIASWFSAGSVFVTIAVVRQEWRMKAFGIATITVATGCAFAGPIAAWLVTGIALAAFLVGFGTVQIS